MAPCAASTTTRTRTCSSTWRNGTMASRRTGFSRRLILLALAMAGGAALAFVVWNRAAPVDRIAVTGTVTLDGRLLQNAVVIFVPAANDGGQRKSGAEI